MFGNAVGNFIGTAYFLYFQVTGILIATAVLKTENAFARLITGSSLGSVMLMWLPSLAAFFMDFTITAHMVVAVIILPVILYTVKNHNFNCTDFKKLYQSAKQNRLFCAVFCATFILWCYLLHTHIIPYNAGSGMWTGQSTYGDMSMHLGFITSIANQTAFPPQYSIFPGTKLAYPFLNAAISSSIYIFGASLRWAYILPMIFAFLQVAGSIYLLGFTVTQNNRKAFFTYILFMFNGGLGFLYFLGISKNISLSFSDIFNGYYTTPTNLIDFNIRWANVIADILLPQRASLFGYSVLFPFIWLLYNAVWKNKKQYFYCAAVFAGALPLIHTHSFLAAGLISAAWLLEYLFINTNKSRVSRWYGAHILIIFTTAMCAVQFGANKGLLYSQHFMAVGIVFIALCVLYGIFLLCRYINNINLSAFLSSWGLYLAIVLAIALPQLLIWTFGQVAEGGFLRGHFNWGNLGDFYPLFYIKNLGVSLFIVVAAVCCKKSAQLRVIFPAAVIWIVAEFILFTPNTYDNNKLLYVAYMLFCIAGADFAVDLYDKIKSSAKRSVYAYTLAVCCVFLCTFSAVLTLGREVVSSYQLFSQPHVELARYIEQNTEPDDVILTGTRHNNEVAVLTGRNIVCGSDIFLYFHGIDTSVRKEHLSMMYTNPEENTELFDLYNIKYAVISSWERNDYSADEYYFENNFEKVFSADGVALYKIR